LGSIGNCMQCRVSDFLIIQFSASWASLQLMLPSFRINGISISLQYFIYTCPMIDYLLFYVPLKNVSLIYVDVIIASEGLQNLCQCSAFRAFEQGRIIHCDKGPRFFRSHPKDRPIQLSLTTRMGMRRTYSILDPHMSIYTCSL
jgi:hypothetical protein